MFFKEVIFPTKIKQVIQIKSQLLEYWKVKIEGVPYMWVKCPVCFHQFKLLNILREDIIDQCMQNNIFHYRALAIKNCPHSAEH